MTWNEVLLDSAGIISAVIGLLGVVILIAGAAVALSVDSSHPAMQPEEPNVVAIGSRRADGGRHITATAVAA